jgi:hypothetical protein
MSDQPEQVAIGEQIVVNKEIKPQENIKLTEEVKVDKGETIYIDPDKVEMVPKEEFERRQKEGDALKKEYDKKARDLYLEMCRRSEYGPNVAVSVFRDLVQEAERSAINVRTVELFMQDWNQNFRENLERGYFKGADGRILTDVLKPTTCMCVGAGPSLSAAEISMLGHWNGCIICSNKSVKRLLDMNVIPTVITALHSTDTVLASFQHEIVRKKLHHSYIVLPTTIHPDVADEILTYADPDKVFWFHASVPEELVPNLDNFYLSMLKVPVCDTGGNVGLFNIALAEQMQPKAIGFIGMELAEPKESVKTNVEALESTFMYFPEDNQEFVLSKVFRGYLQVTMNWYLQQKKQGLPIDIVNCTPFGLIYCRRREWIPYMPLREFLAKYQ